MATKNEKKAKDAAMAARLKADGDKREVLRCPICNAVIGVSQAYTHIGYHPV